MRGFVRVSNVCAVKGYFLIFFTFMTGGSVVYEPSFEGTGQAGYTISVSFGFFYPFLHFHHNDDAIRC